LGTPDLDVGGGGEGGGAEEWWRDEAEMGRIEEHVIEGKAECFAGTFSSLQSVFSFSNLLRLLLLSWALLFGAQRWWWCSAEDLGCVGVALGGG
jgi:hypothetical protein